jgi:DNA-binding LacI/PurR family transcriptional regulator
MTIAQVARRAGVSEPTVSKVLNDKSDVAPATRARVQEILADSGYKRRKNRQSRRTGLVDIVITDLSTSWANEILRGAEEETHRHGKSLVLTVTHDRNADARGWVKMLASRKSDGVILVLSKLDRATSDQLASLNIPLVLIDPVGGADPVIQTVGATNWAGALAATEHLIALGHRRIGIITGPPEVACSQERFEGYRAALGRAGIPFDESLVRYGTFRADDARDLTSELMDIDDPPTAIFACSDQHASGVYAEAHRRRIRIPEDLSVVGFDDVPLCEWLTPQLTTIRQPIADMARLATRAVLDGPSGFGSDGLQHIELSTALVERESTCAPAQR